MSANLDDVAMVNGRLARVIAINDRHRDITFEFVGSKPCPTCGKPDRVSIIEGCRNWEMVVKAVSTCGLERKAPPDG